MTGGAGIGRQAWTHARAARLAAALLAGFGLATLGGGSVASAGTEDDFHLEDLGNFSSPVYVDDAPGPSSNGLLFVVEQRGTIAVLDGGDKADDPFLDIRHKVAAGGEQGLLSVAFHPNYEANRRLYVYYTTKGGDIRIDQFKRRSTSPLRAVQHSRARVIKVEHDQASNHNGGQLQFGPDGFLYAGTGDGGPQEDPENDAQSKTSLLGKLLRIEPKASGGHAVPPSNPFVGAPGRDAIFALGLRNPWRFSFDSANGALVVADVGGSDWEEISYVADGGLGDNFGWNDFEGTSKTSFGIGPNASPHTPPIAEFSHDAPDDFSSITGGYVIRDPDLSQIAGQYIFGDLFEGQPMLRDVPAGTPGDPLGPELAVGTLSSFGEGEGGQIYVVDLGGDVFALEPNP